MSYLKMNNQKTTKTNEPLQQFELQKFFFWTTRLAFTPHVHQGGLALCNTLLVWHCSFLSPLLIDTDTVKCSRAP